MRRLVPAAVALAFLVLVPLAGRTEDRQLNLKCVSKIGDNMYRASNKTVVWTRYYGHDAACEDAEVRLGSDPRITWRNGEYCWVVNVAER